MKTRRCFDCHGATHQSGGVPASRPDYFGAGEPKSVCPLPCRRGQGIRVVDPLKVRPDRSSENLIGRRVLWNVAASMFGMIPWDFSHGMLKKPGEVVTLGDRPITYQGKPVPINSGPI